MALLGLISFIHIMKKGDGGELSREKVSGVEIDGAEIGVEACVGALEGGGVGVGARAEALGGGVAVGGRDEASCNLVGESADTVDGAWVKIPDS
ncbi:hypothetical protein TorRG33x02_227060 [Trema orientale]|uniref:Uncharacterized protein n=1 Tax=Trema orientale TaxID=63057 RepID=A0A2P5E7J7_TREOI|nr:hypothetical protein TorRG33x02_227060 [Trema orientale]